MCMNSQLPEDTCHSLFGYLGKHPGPWWLSSLRLKEAAETLRESCWPKERAHHDIDAATADFRIGPVYMLLMGMAVEAALKAAIVANKPNLVGPRQISKTLGNHHLKDLWGLAEIDKLRSSQRDALLDRLENNVVTFGRYPVSKAANGMDKMRNSSFQGQLHFDRVTRLWTRLEQHMSKTLPQLLTADEEL